MLNWLFFVNIESFDYYGIKYKIFAKAAEFPTDGAIIFLCNSVSSWTKLLCLRFHHGAPPWWSSIMISQMEDHFSQNIVTEHFP